MRSFPIVLIVSVACGGASISSSQPEDECPLPAEEPSPASPTSAPTSTSPTPKPPGNVVFISSITTDSFARTYMPTLPSNLQVGDTLVAVAYANGEINATQVGEETWTPVVQSWPQWNKAVWIGTHRVEANDIRQNGFSRHLFYSTDGFQQMTMLHYRGARRIDPLVIARVRSSLPLQFPGFLAAEGKRSLPFYAAVAREPDLLNAIPPSLSLAARNRQAVVLHGNALGEPGAVVSSVPSADTIMSGYVTFSGYLVAE